jgi:mannose-6-phosphate isomerase
MRLYRLENPVQRYSWGSVDGLANCLGISNAEGGPLAEMWMGAHPKAPSIAITEKGRMRLDDLIQESPEAFLGRDSIARFGKALPFLLKALSAAEPLSVQAHPAKRKAERGFDRENLAGIPFDAPERNYRDRNHKPEMVMALTRFEGLFGFRPIAEIIENVKLVAPTKSPQLIGRLERNPGRVELSVLFYSLIAGDKAFKEDMLARTKGIIDDLLERGKVPPEREAAFRWTQRLRDLYPGDVGVFAPLILNHVVLEPGEALYVAPGQLHAYLKGEALELMANSDNVIRGGLTNKHVDVPELLSVLTFDSERATPFQPIAVSESEKLYPLLASDFRLARIEPGDASMLHAPRGPEILLCTAGQAKLELDGRAVEIGRGEAAFVRADAGEYGLSGNGVVYRAFVPDAEPGRADDTGHGLQDA